MSDKVLFGGPGLRLSKVVPEHTIAVHFEWVHRDFLVMSQQYRRIRRNMSYRGFECWWCERAFKDGETMALAAVYGRGNKMLCQSCADAAIQAASPAAES